jgi:hypothetical protein
MSTTTRNIDETRLANTIVSVLDPAALRACSDDRDAIRYAVRSSTLKLRTIVLGRVALRRLLADPDGEVKVEYLKRELLRCAAQRTDYCYPPSVARPARVSEPEAAAI